ncbi:solute carrier family 26 member 10-like [Malaclemys terrapin pileata]|uniref:solute carrier family 26 member 10-like n=1 Tax=Malaclemys terrapin pileata TaxID=2991368 RepID=UPI0023A8181E|nr:solute carrier family 26 member 10-like [Malaclemys terrapin pileata]XP_053869017.1 solute carrier family 26 member 10-like [Malaclemys terrapin pileata]
MAFALLASVAPVYGLYTSFFPVILYMLFGTGRHVSTGTFAVVSLMTGSVVEQLVPWPLEPNATSAVLARVEERRIGVAAAMAFLVGLLMLVMFVVQLGFLATYLSEPIVKAFTNGAALRVLVSQLPSLLGLALPRPTGSFTIFKTLASVARALPRTNVAELLISVLCLALLVPIKEINSRFRSKLRTPIPGEIVVVLAATGVCFASSLDTRYDVQIVGHLPAGFPQPQLPALQSLPQVLGDTVAIAFVAYAVSVSLAMIYAEKHGYTINPNQELLAHGVSNLVSSLFTCFPSSATLATTNILESAGGHTQLAGFFSSAVVLMVLMWLGPLFRYLPKAVLACINVTSLRQMVLQFWDLPELWRISRIDFAVWVVTWLAVVVLNVDVGLAVGVVFSMMTVICRTQRAECMALGKAADTEIYRPVQRHSKCFEIPGVKIMAYHAPIYYGNRDFFREALSRQLGLSQPRGGRGEKALRALERGAQISTVENCVPSSVPDGGAGCPSSGTAGRTQAAILDCSGIVFVDSAGARLLIQMCVACQKAGIHMNLAACNGEVLETLTSSGLGQHLSPQQVFVTVQDALASITQTTEKVAEKNPAIWV